MMLVLASMFLAIFGGSFAVMLEIAYEDLRRREEEE